MFNIFICNRFYFLEDFDIANHADDSTPYCADNSANFVVSNLGQSPAILFEWLSNNYINVNTGINRLLLSSNYRAVATIYNDHIKLEEDQSVLLGITIDSSVIFDKHISSIFEKASQKLNTRARIAAHMSIQKRRTIMKSFLTSQFGHCLLTWMFHNKHLDNKINSIHERALRITYLVNMSTFQELLNIVTSVSIRHENLQVLATEIFKIRQSFFP